MKLKKTRLSLLIILVTILASCSTATEPVANGTAGLNVSVSILPEKYFVERIGGSLVKVNVMAGPGDSPHSYEPKPSQMAALSDSDVYFAIGVEFEEAWLERMASANPDMQIVDLSEGIVRIPSLEDHDENKESDDQDELDPHIWTSPAISAEIANKITATLIQLDPKHSDTYDANLEVLLEDITMLQGEISQSLKTISGSKFMVFHPSWGYFAQEFGLEQIPIEIGGSEPSVRELADLISFAREEQIKIIFAQPEFSTRSADYIAAEINGRVILISPLAEDWLENMRQVASIFAEVL